MNMPDRAVIEKLLLGQLSPEIAEALCRQLEDEAAFAHVAGIVMQDDTFVGGLRSASTMETESLSPDIENLIRRFRSWESEMLHGGTVAAPGQGSTPDFTPDPAARVAKSSDTIDLDLGGSDPTHIGGFRILRKLGQGGMGAVYLGEDTKLKRKAALKVMRPEMAKNAEASERFLREARAAAAIEHDHIVAIWQVGEDEGSPFIAMPFLQGESLEDRLKREPRSPVGAILKLGREAAMGLAAAHERGLIHRDIKPANIWIEGEPASTDAAKAFRRTKILDFGLARGNEDVQLTSTGAILGTPAFMSPEQGRGIPLDARSDLFSLGVVLYRMATGVQPFTGNTIMAMLTSLAVDVPPSPTTRNDRIPPLVSELILKLMHKEPEHRYQSADEVVSEIQGIVRQLTSTLGATRPVEMPKPVVEVAKPVAVPKAVEAAKPAVNPFDDIDADGGTEIIPASGPLRRPAPRPVRVAEDIGESSPPKSRKGLWLGLGGAALVLMMGFVVIKVTNKDGSVTELKVPDDAKIEIVKGKADDGKDKADTAKQKGAVAELPPLSKFTYTPVPVGQSPFDKLDPKEIPKAERFDWQPKELVAVIGTHERRHWFPSSCIAISPDGKHAASQDFQFGQGGSTGWINLYDVRTLKTIKVIDPPNGWADSHQLIFSPDSLSLWLSANVGFWACSFSDPEPKWRPFSELSPEAPFSPDPKRLGYSHLVYSPNGKLLVFCSWEGKSCFFCEMIDGNPKPIREVPDAGEFCGFTPDQNGIYTAKRRGPEMPWQVRIIGAKGGEPKTILTYPGKKDAGSGCVATPDGTTLAVPDFTDRRTDTLYDATVTPVREKSKVEWPHGTGGRNFSPDGKTLNSFDHGYRFDLTRTPPEALEPIPQHSLTYQFTPDGKRVMCTHTDGIRFWDLTGDKPKELAPSEDPISIGWSIDTERPLIYAKGLLATPALDPKRPLKFWELIGSKLVERSGIGKDEEFKLDGAQLRAVSEDGEIAALLNYQHKKSTVRARWTPKGYEPTDDAPWFDYFDRFGPNVVAMRHYPPGSPWRLWDIREPYAKSRELTEIGSSAGDFLTANPHRSLVVVHVRNGAIPSQNPALWSLAGEKAAKVGEIPEPLWKVKLSPDGRWLSGVDPKNQLALYDLSGKQPRRAALRDGVPDILSIAFSPDAKRMIVCGRLGYLRCYDLTTLAVLWDKKLPGLSRPEMAADNRHLFLYNANGTVYVLRLDDPAKPAALPPGELPPLPKFTYTPVPAGQSPFDKLDPKMIPQAERFDWQPKELVAVIGTHERRHWGDVQVATSPDGKWGASWGWEERIVRLYDMKIHTEVRSFRHDLKIDQMVFSPDGLAFWASTEKGIMACPIRESKFAPVDAFAETPEFRWMRFSPDLKILLLYGPDRKAQVWDVEPGKLSLRKTLDDTGVELGFSADRKSVYWARQKAEGRPWEIEAVSLEKDKADRSTILTFPADSGPMWNGESGPAMLVSPDGKTLAVMDKSGKSDDCTLYDLTASPPKQKTTFSWKAQVQGGMIFSPDSRTLCRSASQIHRFDVTQFPPVKLGTIETISPSTRSFSPDSKTILTGDRTFIRFFDVGGEKPKELAPLKNVPSAGSQYEPEFSPMLAPGKGLLALQTHRTLGDLGVRFWDLTGSRPKVWPTDDAPVLGALAGGAGPFSALSPSGEFAVVCEAPYVNKLGKWTAKGFEFGPSLPASFLVRTLSTPDGFNLLLPDAENKPPHYRLWDIGEPFEAARELPEFDGMAFRNVAVRSDRGLLVTAVERGGDGDRTATVWDISGKIAKKVAVLPCKYLRTEISPDGRWLVALDGWAGHVYRLDGKQPRRATQFGDDLGAGATTFSPDAKRVYLGDYQGNLRGYDLATGKVVWEAKLPGAAAWMQMAPDGRHLFTHNANGTVYVLRLDDPAKPAVPAPK